MMNFRIIKQAIVQILTDAAGGCYQVIDHQRQKISAESAEGNDRQVQVYYVSSDFPKSGSANTGPVKNNAVYRINLIVAGAAEADLETATGSDMSSFDKAEAQAAAKVAGAVVDDSMDELIELVYQALMDANELDIRQTPGIIGGRWVDQVQKDQTISDGGEFVVLTANMFFEINMIEKVVGIDASTATGNIIETVVDIDQDDIEQTGVTANN